MKPSNLRLLTLIVSVSTLLSGCFPVVQQVHEMVAVNGKDLPITYIPQGQLIRVLKMDRTVFNASFVAVTATDLVTREHTSSSGQTKTPLAMVAAISYDHVVDTRVRAVQLPIPLIGNIPIDPIGPLGPIPLSQ